MLVIFPFPNSFGSNKNLDMIIYSDGSTHITSEIEVNPLNSNHEIKLFGKDIDNLLSFDENEYILKSSVTENYAMIETFGNSKIFLEYDVHDLVSKQGRIWTFSINSDNEFTVTFPKNTVIVGMNSIPIDTQLIDNQNQLLLSEGYTEIDYLFSSTNTPINKENNDYSLIYIILISLVIIPIIFLIKKNSAKIKKSSISADIIPKHESTSDSENSIELKIPEDVREDDKLIIKFISDNGGEALESELRKKFLLPRTTMWRAVKRLERNGLVEIKKKDSQNLVKLRTEDETSWKKPSILL